MARVDEQLHSDWPPEQSAGRLRLDYPEDAGHALSLGDHLPPDLSARVLVQAACALAVRQQREGGWPLATVFPQRLQLAAKLGEAALEGRSSAA